MCWMPSGVCFRFLSTPSARRATLEDQIPFEQWYQFLSTPSARRATDVHMDEDPRIHISIHALREEGDRRWPRVEAES